MRGKQDAYRMCEKAYTADAARDGRDGILRDTTDCLEDRLTEGFSLPASAAACLAEFDDVAKAFSDIEVSGALRSAIKEPDKLTAEERAACNAEVTAFSLVPDARDSPWDSYFGPLATGETSDGKPFYSPDVAHAAKGTADYWELRARSVKNPILQARYADAAWDLGIALGRPRRNPEMARLAFDAYLATKEQDDFHHKLEATGRALELAITLRDDGLIAIARQAMLDLHREAVSTKRQWWFVYDRLIDNKKAGLTEDDRQSMVRDLEGLLVHFSDHSPDKFDPHHVQSIAKMLSKYYEQQKKPDEVKRLHAAVGKAFERFGSMGDGLLGSLVLGDAVAAYAAAGMQAEAENARLLLERKAVEAKDQMVPITSSVEIPTEEMEKYLAAVVVDDAGQTLANIASDLLAKRKELQGQIEETARSAPLMSTIGMSVLSDNRVSAKIGSTEDDLLGRLLQQGMLHFRFSNIWLHGALQETIKRHGLTPDHFVAWARRSGLYESPELLREGLKAWFDGDYAKAIHVLIPQVEKGLREIVGLLGKPTSKPSRQVQGVSEARNMGDMLFGKDVQEALGPDLTVHLQAMYSDPRGWNLRNDFAHGLMSIEEMSQQTAQWVVHTILLFGLWREFSQASRPKPAEESK